VALVRPPSPGARLAAAQQGKRSSCARRTRRRPVFTVRGGATTFDARQVTDGVWAMSMDTEASLREYLKLNLKIPIMGRIGPLAKAFDFVATAAPGVREILTVGKLCYEVRERNYDLVVVDAAASGHIVSQLAAPQPSTSWSRWASSARRPTGCSTSSPTRGRPGSLR